MPKVKKIRAKALGTTTTSTNAAAGGSKSGSDRHEPLGQVITDETNKKLYATLSNRQPKKMKHSSLNKDINHRLNYNPHSSRNNKDDDDDDEDQYDNNGGGLLDEKSSHKIMELSKVQQIELEAEEQQEQQLLKQRRQQQQRQEQQQSQNLQIGRAHV